MTGSQLPNETRGLKTISEWAGNVAHPRPNAAVSLVLSLFAHFEWPALRCAQETVSVVTETRSIPMRGVYPNAVPLHGH